MVTIKKNCHIKTTSAIAFPGQKVIDLPSFHIIWNHKKYGKENCLGGDLLTFVVWLVKTDNFCLVINGREFIVNMHGDGYGYWAIIPDSYEGRLGPFAVVHNHPIRALQELVINLEEAIAEGTI